MTKATENVITRLVQRACPRTPDFHDSLARSRPP